MSWKILASCRKGLIVSTVLLFCGILSLKKTDYLSMDAYVSLSALDIKNSKPIIYHKMCNTQISKSSNSSLSELNVNNSDNAITAAAHPVIKVTQNAYSTKHEANSTVHPVTRDTQDLKYKHSRFVLCYSYWEQQTNALINMWSFQKWAHKSGSLKVVEPFAAESMLKFPDSVLYKHQFTNTLRFRDYFDLDYWTKKTAKLGIEPLVTWETFIKYANRKMILAILSYGSKPPGIYVDDEINKNERCKSEQDKISHSTKSLFEFLHFEVIKIVCFAMSYKQIISFEKFNSYLIPNNNATIWFGYWYGIGRLPMRGDRTLDRAYGGIESVLSMVRPNPKIIADSRHYVKTVLNVDFREYTAINIRSARRYAEMVLKGHSATEVMNYLTNCVVKLNNILDKSGSISYFVSTDIGRFGDRTHYKVNDDNSAKLLKQILQVVYGNKTIDIYQNEFIEAANGIEDRGYIASMQKAITVNAKCLIMMGGFSTFQKSVVLNYRNSGQFNCIKYLCYEEPVKQSHKNSHSN